MVTGAGWYAVVIAGGSSRRFGSDKLEAMLGSETVLDHALSALPADWEVVVVGPVRKVGRPVTFVREEPVGAGPGAALVAGAREVVARGGQRMVALPGDAPAGGRAAVALAASLTGAGTAVVAVDESGQVQPLQVAVAGTGLTALASHSPSAVAGISARKLVAQLCPRQTVLPRQLTADIDTVADAQHWLQRLPN